ncbi:efflux RND transporter permease subunit [Methylobacterium oryzae]|uniref:efflux RND transporter permease subunit n=1 Tax=Methylobacterium oryzae TaxID=334852 RepID=UPI002F354A88
MQVVGFHGYPSIEIFGGGAPGEASGDPVAVMERPATRSSPGFDVARTGPSLREKRLGRRAVDLLVLALLRVFLGVAAPSESRAVPPAVLLAVPTGVVGAIFETLVRGVPNDVQFKVGLITVIGLTAKTAILIIEEAGEALAKGRDVQQAALEACGPRFRPIIVASLALILGAVPAPAPP